MSRYRQKTKKNYKAIGLMCFLRRKILAGLEREYGGLVEAKSNCHFSQSDFQIITL